MRGIPHIAFVPKTSIRTTAAREHTASAMTSIRRLVRLLRLSAEHTRTSAGISAAQLFVLQQLREDTELSLTELASRTLTDRSSVAAVVDRLASRRLVDRTINENDRRRAAVRITAAGRRVLQRAPSAPTAGLIDALHELTPREVASLARSLDHLIRALGATETPAPLLFADELPLTHRDGRQDGRRDGHARRPARDGRKR